MRANDRARLLNGQHGSQTKLMAPTVLSIANAPMCTFALMKLNVFLCRVVRIMCELLCVCVFVGCSRLVVVGLS